MNRFKRLGLGAIFVAHLLNVAAVEAVPVPEARPRTIAAPPLLEGKAAATTDLGLWDDVFVPHNQDFIVLRQGDQFFSLFMDASAKPTKIAKTPAANDTQVFAGVAIDKKLWLFLNSTKASPCAVDAFSGTVVSFEIPGVKVPGSHAPGIQSSHIAPHIPAALLMVSGGDRETWPRDGNRPVYFWMDLKSGKMVRFPIGWELGYFSADEGIAAFGPTRPIDMKTGEQIETAPNRRKELCSPFDWSNTLRVRPLYEHREGKGSADYFAGLSVEGRVLPVSLGLDEVRYLSMAKSDDSHAAFRLRPSGASHLELSPLWMTPFKDTKKTESIADDVIDFTMLGYGNTVYVTVEKPLKRAAENRHHAEAIFYARGERTSWNVLEGVERLPKLNEALAEASFIQDSLRVRLVEGFGGSKHEPAALCLFEHHRGDRRSFVLGSDGPALESVTWRRAILVGRDGKRSLTPLFRDGNLPDHIWLHHSGTVFSGTYHWAELKGERKRQVQVSVSTVQKP